MADLEIMENYKEEKDKYINELWDHEINYLTIPELVIYAETAFKANLNKLSYSEVKTKYKSIIGE
tara:strand:+ start:745 stop:939 length:195 start_codon:yes stop_codon:yes gene_type:complete